MGALHDVEHEMSAERTFQLRLLRILSRDAQFDAAWIVARVTGCELGTARNSGEPASEHASLGLFRPQALRFVHELRVASVEAEVV
jgi:hypothetical protein